MIMTWKACKEALGTLKVRAKSVRDMDDELRRLGLMKAEANAQIEAATEGDIGSPAAQRQIGEARLTLDMAGARERKLLGPNHKSRVEARKFYHETSGLWNDVVRELRKEKEAELVAALLPFAGGDERLLHKRIYFQAAPCFDVYKLALHDKGFYPELADANANLARDVEMFLAFVAKEQKKLGLS